VRRLQRVDRETGPVALGLEVAGETHRRIELRRVPRGNGRDSMMLAQ